MRIRKLAKELKLTEQEVFGLLHGMGHMRYINAEQMLPTEIVEQVRKRGPPAAPKVAAWRPPEAREIRDLDRPTKSPPIKASRPVPAAPAAPAAPPKPTTAKVEPVPVSAATAEIAGLRGLLHTTESDLVACRERITALDAELASSENHRRALLRALAVASVREPRQSVREAFIRRGLLGDDEIAHALRAWGEAHRLQELLEPLHIASPDVFQALLDERMLLIGPGEDCPAGIVPVVVGPERSERCTATAVRTALARMSTALLINSKKRIVVHGGAAAWQREFKQGLDPRIELRFYPHLSRGPLPDTGASDVVVLWDSAVSDPRLTDRYPEALLILHRGLIPFCQAVVDQIERA
jgi:hypothetical protein